MDNNQQQTNSSLNPPPSSSTEPAMPEQQNINNPPPPQINTPLQTIPEPSQPPANGQMQTGLQQDNATMAATPPMDDSMHATVPLETKSQPASPPPPTNNSELFLPDGNEDHENHHNSSALPKVLIGALIVAIILVGGGLFFLNQNNAPKPLPVAIPTQPPTPTPDPTAGWLMYTDSKGGFSVQYPPTGAFTTGKPYTGSNGTEEIPAAFIIGNATLTILPNFREKTFTPITTETVTVGAVQTQKEFESTNSAIVKSIPLSSTQTIAFSYKLPDDPQNTQETNKLFDLILSTFKTVASTESAETTMMEQ